ncbi:hypothetical protein GSQ54_15850 [Clostridioides difficile]|nr:hypothetical protein [Clostridioides difficile]
MYKNFDTDFFKRVFINKPLNKDKALSGTSLRLAALLMDYLNIPPNHLEDYAYAKLPKRTDLAKKLDVSVTSIVDSLVELEENNFIIRKIPEYFRMIRCTDEENSDWQDKRQKLYESKKKSRVYSDEFIINKYYGMETKAMSYEEIKNNILFSQSQYNLDKIELELTSRINKCIDSYFNEIKSI